MHEKLFDLLRHDHQEVKEIFLQLEKSPLKSHREELVTRLAKEIEPHLAGEERAFYPALKKTDESWEAALEAVEQHSVVKTVLNELLETPGDDERFAARAGVLGNLVRQHIEEEESRVFDHFVKAVDREEAQGVLNGFLKEKSKKKEALAKGPVMV